MRMSRRMALYAAGGKFSEDSFTFTGAYNFYDNGGGNWALQFLESGTFTPKKNIKIDLHLVGGGGGASTGGVGGGGGGKTATYKGANAITANSGTPYTIIVGGGGTGAANGGNSTAFGKSAAGGKTGATSSSSVSDRKGGDGGSGGGGYGYNLNGGAGGTNGGNGGTARGAGGAGQGTPTRDFGETTQRILPLLKMVL